MVVIFISLIISINCPLLMDFPSRLIIQLVTGKSITMPCNFKDLQGESSAVLSEADVRKRLNLRCGGGGGGFGTVSAVQ